MAELREFAPFILKWEAGLNARQLTLPLAEMFAEAKQTGFANDPDDRGGATMCGVTLDTLSAWRYRHGHNATAVANLRAITLAEWLSVLREGYWDKWRADEIASQSVAEILVDWVWASGGYGIKIPQRMLRVAADGVVGRRTLAAVNECDPRALFDEIKGARLQYCEDIVRRNPSQRKWLKGWTNRINDLKFKG